MVKASEERDSLLLDKKNLEKEVADFKATMLPVEEKPEGISSLKTCVELASQIQVLESDCMDALSDSFETVVVQLAVLNPELNTEGARVLSQVVDGKVVPPPDSFEPET